MPVADKRIEITSMDMLQSTSQYQYSNYTEVIFCLPDAREPIDIPDKMFANSRCLKKVVFRNGVGKIGSEAFSHCSSLGDVVFEKEVREIGSYAFCDLPLTQIEFKSDVQKIGEGAFDNCGYAAQTLVFIVPRECPNIHRFAQATGTGYNVQKSQKGQRLSAVSDYPLEIYAKNFSVSIKKKQILAGINITIHPNEMIMIIGGSGTGKSTLLKYLFGLEPNDNIVSVRCKIPGKPAYKGRGKPHSRAVQSVLRRHVFYAPQFTVSNDYLTVEQEIQKNALMFMDREYTKEELQQLAARFKLNGILLKTQVGKISGGQKKKLLMACSQSSNPQIYAFDEPDSGLDEPSAFNLFITDLRKNEVDGKGKTVIVVSHHPHNFMSDFTQKDSNRTPFEEIFSRLIVLARGSEGGTIVFDGRPRDARTFFGLYTNDPYSRIVSKVTTVQEGGESTQADIDRYIQKRISRSIR